jgi:5-methyltetrahydrofolate--homocysteine methyltransferase
MSAEAARAAFDRIRAALLASGQETKSRGKILLATVEGDIHDIGKNIVKVLLENYGFQVIDLGRDVSAEAVAEAAVREEIRLVGLSALMTTTVPGMEKTIRLLKQRRPGTLVMVGGAVLTEDYACQIGADFYGKDAMASVNYAMKVFA